VSTSHRYCTLVGGNTIIVSVGTDKVIKYLGVDAARIFGVCNNIREYAASILNAILDLGTKST
jgi:hypothetical protein